jgi:hypothetical protein
MQFTSLISAEPGWKALYGSDGLEESRSRIVAWAIMEGDHQIVGIVVDPSDRTRLISASEVVDPDGSTLIGYGYAGTVSSAGSPQLPSDIHESDPFEF